MKVLVRSTDKTRGLMNTDGNYIESHRVGCAFLSQLLEGRMAKGDFKLLVANLSDEATDEKFAQYLDACKGDELLAMDSFEAAFTTEESRKGPTPEEVEKERKRLEQEQADREKEGREQAARNQAAADKAEADRLDAEKQEKAKAAQAEKDLAKANANKPK